MKRETNWTKILLAFLIATFLFFFGLFIGYLSNQIIEKNTNFILEETKNEIFSLESLSLLQEDYPCDSYIMDKVSEKLDSLGRIITIFEEDKGLNNKEVLELKKVYTLIQLRHFILINKLNENCQRNYSTILFFYSNEKKCEKEVNEKSFILSFLRNKYDFVRVYSFDLNLDSEIIPFFKKTYNLEGCSEIVLNEKKVEEDVKTSKDLEKYLN
jgi:hypothetical protein